MATGTPSPAGMTPASFASSSQTHSRQPSEGSRTPVSSRPLNDWAHGVKLRKFLLSGTLSPDAQHALMHMPQLRKGLVGSPVPDDVRQAILSGPLNSGLRPVLLNELHKHTDTVPQGSRSTDGGGTPSRGPVTLTTSAKSTPGSTAASKTTTSGTGSTGGDVQPVKKVFTMRRSNVPERPSLLSLGSGPASSSSISRAPFKPLPPDSPTSPDPAKVVSDVVPTESTQTLGITKEVGTAGSISGILRGSSAELQGVKRKRDENLDVESQGSAQNESRASIGSALEPHSSTASVPLLTGWETIKKFGQEGLSVLSFSKTKPKPNIDHSVAAGSDKSATNSNDVSSASPQDPISRAAQPKTMRERTSMPVYNIKKLTYNRVKRSSNADAAADPRPVAALFSDSSTRSSPDGADVDMVDTVHDPRIFDESSDDGDYEMGDVDDETDVEETHPPVTSKTPDVAPAELTAENGRPYNRWPSTDGKLIPCHGALLPTGYKPRQDLKNPWICPVRTCRVMLLNLDGLGAHFNRRHSRSLLNDNGDGTLSVIRVRDKGAVGKMPAMVVSKKPLDPKEEPLATPSLPGYQPKHAGNVSNRSSLSALIKTKIGPPGGLGEDKHRDVFEDLDKEEDYKIEHNAAAMSMWKLVHPHLTKTPFSPIPIKGYVPELLVLPFLRDIDFNPRSNKYFESRPQDISAMIMQMTGQEAREPCKRCREGKGPFIGCVVISPDAPLWARRPITGCANCFYKGTQTYCDLNAWSRKTYPELTEAAIPSVPPARPSLQSTASSNSLEKGTSTPERRSGRVFAKTSSPAAKLSTRVPQPVAGSELGVRHVRNKAEANPSQSTRRGAAAAAESRSSVANNDNTLTLSMEDWEIAPGRIRNESSEDAENIAFSAAYLAHGEEVSIARDVGFHVLVIKPGTTHRFTSAADRMRLCSVATGKVKVKTLGQDFDVGPNGMFQVKPGKTCVVENRLYGDATLHVTAMPSEFPG